jgi:hypothetical protein
MTLLRKWYQLLSFQKAGFISLFLFIVLLVFAVPRGRSALEGDTTYWHSLMVRLASVTMWRKAVVAATAGTILALTVSFLVLWVGTLLRPSSGMRK